MNRLEDGHDLPEPQDGAGEAITELEAVVDDLREIPVSEVKDEGMTTDYAEDADKKFPRKKSSVKSV